MSSTTTGRLEIAEAQAFPLLGLVNYQEGSVVSRVILKREKGNITVFAFDEGQALSETTSPFDALVQVMLPEFFYADCTCRSAAELMATEGIASLPVVDRTTQRINGTITLQDLLKRRSKAVVRENERLRLVNQLDNARGEHN